MLHSFSFEAQGLFARLSGDYNPIHLDPLAARRLLYGRPVVHGIHVLLWVLDRWLAGETNRVCLTSVSVKFRSPCFLDEVAEFAAIPEGSDRIKLAATANGVKLLTATVAWQSQITAGPDVPSEIASKADCRDRSAAELCTANGRIPLCLERSIASRLFPHVVHCLPAEQVAALLATSRLVGMEAPGLHSLFTGLDLKATGTVGEPANLYRVGEPANLYRAREPALVYRVESYDERVSLLNLRVDAPGFTGLLKALLRPAPREQATIATFRGLGVRDEFRNERALVVGGSRGLGEAAVKALSVGGAQVRLTYHRGAHDAERVTSEAVSQGGAAQCFAYDVLTDADALAARVGSWSPTMLCYFATPFISPGIKGQFSRARFAEFCEYYVRGFHDTFQAARRLGDDLQFVLCPSSSLIDELPPTFAEYVAAKSASETLCRLLEKTYRGIRISAPRFPRLSTDQTASVLAGDVGDSAEAVLAGLREMRASGRTNPPD
jgi:NAD(P)-dependent dehydrogenase (short-subunit alcohol dehydrogenase family)